MAQAPRLLTRKVTVLGKWSFILHSCKSLIYTAVNHLFTLVNCICKLLIYIAIYECKLAIYIQLLDEV